MMIPCYVPFKYQNNDNYLSAIVLRCLKDYFSGSRMISQFGGKSFLLEHFHFFLKTPFGDFYGGPIYDKEMVCSTQPRITNQTRQSLDGLGVAFQVLMSEDSGSNPEAGSIYSFDEDCPGLGLLQPQWNPYPTFLA